MWTITVRDLQYRGRQFGIAVAGASVVFALTLVLTGISAGFRHEARNTVKAVGADAWVVPKGVPGPFTAQTTVPVKVAAKIANEPGVDQARPLIRSGANARVPSGEFKQVNIMGHRIGPLGPPDWSPTGAGIQRGQVVADRALGVKTGDKIRIAGARFRVSGVVEGQTFFAGVPIVWTDLADAQALLYRGSPLASVIVTKGVPKRVPKGYTVLQLPAVRHDILEPLKGAVSAIDSLRILMWIVAAVIVGAVVYLSALERVRDFAVLKAVGASSRDLVGSVALQAIAASILAALLGSLVAQVLKPIFPLPVSMEAGAYLALPVIALVVGVLASLAALRRAVSIDPALAFSN